MVATPAPPISSTRSSFLPRPIPCSPVQVPPTVKAYLRGGGGGGGGGEEKERGKGVEEGKGPKFNYLHVRGCTAIDAPGSPIKRALATSYLKFGGDIVVRISTYFNNPFEHQHFRHHLSKGNAPQYPLIYLVISTESSLASATSSLLSGSNISEQWKFPSPT